MGMTSNQIIGDIGERLTLNRLKNLGRAKRQTVRHCGDIQLGNIRIEVKTAKPGKVNQKYTGWQFCLRRAGFTDIDHSDFVILICLNDDNEAQHVFIIPVDILRESRRKISIIQGKSTKWHNWKGRFDLIESAIQESSLEGFDFDNVAPIEF